MPNITNKLNLAPELVQEMFNLTRGHSTLAKLCGAEPVAFNGNNVMTFNLDGEVAIVGEGGEKPAGSAKMDPVTIVPVKVVYQHRLSDEFVYASDEVRLPYLKAFTEGFAKKIARGFDIMAMHGLNPATGTTSSAISGKSFDTLVTSTVTYNAATVDENIDDAVAAVQASDGIVTGIAWAPAAASAMGKLKSGLGYLFPEFRFGANPESFGGMGSDVNTTVSFGNTTTDKAIVGDFANAFRWGYAAEIPLEVIEYGDPDGLGDLKRHNQIVLRSEAYIGWGILDPDSFARVEA